MKFSRLLTILTITVDEAGVFWDEEHQDRGEYHRHWISEISAHSLFLTILCIYHIVSRNNQNTNISVSNSDHPTTKPGLRNIHRNTHMKNNAATPYSWKVMGPKFLYLSCITWEYCHLSKSAQHEFEIALHNFSISSNYIALKVYKSNFINKSYRTNSQSNFPELLLHILLSFMLKLFYIN